MTRHDIEKTYNPPEFQDQGGAATMNPSPLMRWLTSKILNRLVSDKRTLKQRDKAERQRIRKGAGHVVEYFHQLEDGYSHLAVQLLKPLLQDYDIELRCHLVSGPAGDNAVEPDLLIKLSAYDASHIASYYGLDFPEKRERLDASLIKKATAILAAQDNEGFIAHAAHVGSLMWSGDASALQVLADNYGSASSEQVETCIAMGNARRESLRHYSGGMFYYIGEWYWGVDRLYHLENRLIALGAKTATKNRSQNTAESATLLAPRPNFEVGQLKDNGSLTFEIYPSLRSPYTAISFDRAVKLARDTGVKLVVRPVLPMVMRGVPATREKGMYIFKDAVREARMAGVPFGSFYDPIGEPVKRCYSLYPWACEQGKGIELLSCFLRAAFADGVNTNNDKGLQAVVKNAGLDWQEAKALISKPGWEDLLEKNRHALYGAGLWGVPSFRLLDKNGKQILALWGQDRLWLFAQEIQRLLAADA